MLSLMESSERQVADQGTGLTSRASPEHDVDKGAPVNAGQVHHQPVGRLQVRNAGADQHHECQDDKQRHADGHAPHYGESSIVEVGQDDRDHEE